jgi:hypothetical protein
MYPDGLVWVTRFAFVASRYIRTVGLFEWEQISSSGLRMMGLLVAAPHGRRGRATPFILSLIEIEHHERANHRDPIRVGRLAASR